MKQKSIGLLLAGIIAVSSISIPAVFAEEGPVFEMMSEQEKNGDYVLPNVGKEVPLGTFYIEGKEYTLRPGLSLQDLLDETGLMMASDSPAEAYRGDGYSYYGYRVRVKEWSSHTENNVTLVTDLTFLVSLSLDGEPVSEELDKSLYAKYIVSEIQASSAIPIGEEAQMPLGVTFLGGITKDMSKEEIEAAIGSSGAVIHTGKDTLRTMYLFMKELGCSDEEALAYVESIQNDEAAMKEIEETFALAFKNAEYTLLVNFKNGRSESVKLILNTSLPGDVDQTGQIDVLDAVKLQKYLLNMNALTGTAYQNADVFHDDAVDVFDLAFLKRYLTK